MALPPLLQVLLSSSPECLVQKGMPLSHHLGIVIVHKSFPLKVKCAKVLQEAQLQPWQCQCFAEQYLTHCRCASQVHSFSKGFAFCFCVLGFFFLFAAVLVTALSNTLLELFICLYSLYSVIPVLPWLCAGLQPGSVVEQESGLVIVTGAHQLCVEEQLQG